MKRFFRLNCIKWAMFLIAMLANIGILSGQSVKERNFPIPDSINKIFQSSCMPCHGSQGGRLPGARLNFSRWKGYGAAKEVEKASLICSAVKKGKMPPRLVRDSKPENIPTKEQADLICKWAEALKAEKERK